MKTRAEILGENLERVRKSKNVSRETLASVMGVGIASVSLYELGKRLPPIDKVFKAAEFLGVGITEIVGDTAAAGVRGIERKRAAELLALAGFTTSPAANGFVLIPPAQITCENGMFVAESNEVFKFRAENDVWALVDAAERFAITNDQTFKATLMDFLKRR